VGQGVGLCGNHIAKSPVDSPRVKSLGYLFIICGILAVFVEIPASGAYVAFLVNLIEVTINLSVGLNQRQ
jgi:hypothetical protein